MSTTQPRKPPDTEKRHFNNIYVKGGTNYSAFMQKQGIGMLPVCKTPTQQISPCKTLAVVLCVSHRPGRGSRACYLQRTHGVNIHIPVAWVDDAQQAVQVGAAHEDLPAVSAAYALHQRGCGADQFCLAQFQALDPFGQTLRHQKRLVLRFVALFMTVRKFDKLAEGGIAVAQASLDFDIIEGMIVMACCCLDAEMLRIEGLNNDTTRMLSTSGAARHLGEQCKGAFRCG